MSTDKKRLDFPEMVDDDGNEIDFLDYVALQKEKEDKLREEIDHHAIKNTTSQDIRKQVLDHSIPMIEMVQKAIYKDQSLTGNQHINLDRLWPVIENILKQTSDIQKIEAKNASDVIKLISDGKITLEDAQKFLLIMKTQVEIDELPKLMEKLSLFEDVQK